mmetsp:Transcript_102691/g.160229  ORF Transcript_102691/g.160229 Transcript_102691/m.160229 type:complete len:123 (+) Transcript_102691:917-1285(+)
MQDPKNPNTTSYFHFIGSPEANFNPSINIGHKTPTTPWPVIKLPINFSSPNEPARPKISDVKVDSAKPIAAQANKAQAKPQEEGYTTSPAVVPDQKASIGKAATMMLCMLSETRYVNRNGSA